MADLRIPAHPISRGEIDPRLSAQVTHEVYAKGAEKMRNALSLPQGGFTWRPSTRYLATLPRKLEEVSLSSSTLSAPNGGTAANAVDGDSSTELETTTGISTTNPYVVFQVTLSSDADATFVDVEDLRTTSSAESVREFKVQWSTAAAPTTWNDMGTAVYQVDGDKRTRRFTGPTTDARHFRLVRVGATDLGTGVAIFSSFKLFIEMIGALSASEARLVDFEFAQDQRYVLAHTDRNVRIFKDDVFQVDCPSPITSAQLSEIDHAHELDTLLLFHENVATHRIQRQIDASIGDVHDAWDARPWPYVNVPKAAFGRVTTNTGDPAANAGSGVVFAAGSELAALKVDSSAGTRTITVTTGNTNEMRVGQLISIAQDSTEQVLEIQSINSSTTFTVDQIPVEQNTNRDLIGGDFKASDVGKFIRLPIGFAEIKAYNNRGSVNIDWVEPSDDANPVKARVWRIVEDAFSATRGWPGCGAFHEGRLFVARTPDLPQSVWASRAQDPQDFDSSRSDDDFGFERTPATANVPRVTNIVPGPHLQVLTTNGLFYVPATDGAAGGLTPSNAAVRRTTSKKAKLGVKAVDALGLTIFAGSTGGQVLGAAYDGERLQSFQAEPMSRLSAHLVTGIQDMAWRETEDDDEANYLWVVNGDGTMASLCLTPDENVAAWNLQTTDGLFKSVATLDVDTYVIVEREVNGVTQRFLEKLDSSLLYDAAISGTGSSTTITGLGHLEGERVGVTIDGQWQQTKTVSGGQITPTAPGTSTWQVGLPWPIVDGGSGRAWVRTVSPENGGRLMGRTKRIVKADVEYHETQGMWVGAANEDGSVARVDKVSFQSMPSGVLDQSVTPFTGQRETVPEPISDQKVYLDFKRSEPYPATVLGFAMEVRT